MISTTPSFGRDLKKSLELKRVYLHWCSINELRLIKPDPPVRILLGKVMVVLAQLSNEIVCMQAHASFRVALNSGAECNYDIVSAWHDLPPNYTVYKYS